MRVQICSSVTLDQCLMKAPHVPGEVQDAYVIAKEKDLPKLHRAVWKGDLTKVKQLTKNAKERELNARDKEER